MADSNIIDILPEMLTVTEAAKKTGLTEYAVRQLVKNRKIVFVRPTTKILINYNSLLRYLNKGDIGEQC